MPVCGTQCILCDLPVRFDNYKGCTHNCRYCFVQRKNGALCEVTTDETEKSLSRFIEGKRDQTTRWCDWNIPIHWGGLSDPFQPIEKKYKSTLKCLKVFEKSQYPFVVSTKGKLVGEDEYLDILKNCNCVVQISLVCNKYDKLETGAPTFAERLKIIEKIAPKVKRVIVRIQPYMCEVFKDVFNNLTLFKNAGVYGVVLEGMKFQRKKSGLIRLGADFTYPYERLRNDFIRLKEECHRLGLKFYSGENRLRAMGDSLTCCGIDGLDDFIPNRFNICHMISDKEKVEATKGQSEVIGIQCFKALLQNSLYNDFVKNNNFKDAMIWYFKTHKESMEKIFGVVHE